MMASVISPPAPAASPPRTAARTNARAVSNWLLGVAALVLLMIIVGGITRLTESGLSITRWEPVSGVIPPLTLADWLVEFDRYRATPEYSLVNRGMSLAEFRFIYFWEWAHRLLGRLIGLAFALPLAWFALRRMIPPGYGPRLVALLALGGAQGAVGWWMVKSGLVDRVDVAHERLAVHLLMALTIFAALIWTALDLRAARAPVAVARRWVWPFFGLMFVQFLFGAFTAGLKAGRIYSEWPLMGGGLVPPELGYLAPLWRDIVDNPVTVQFIHRSLAIVVASAALLIAWRMAKAGAGWRAGALGFAVIVQFALGVLTLIHAVPIGLGVAHQGWAAVLLASAVALAHWAWTSGPALRR